MREDLLKKDVERYFELIQAEVDRCYKVARNARSKGLDPSTDVEIPQAKDLAARVEELVGPEGIACRIRELDRKLGDREIVAIEIAREIAREEVKRHGRVDKAIEQAVRTGLAIITEGVLVAPIEGIASIKIGRNDDGTRYVDIYFSGPIRSAGGTGQAMSVLLADVVRRDLGIDRYKPTRGEIERFKEEIPLYKRVQHLQYLPSPDEIELIVANCPVCINGEGTEKEEVTGYRDLPRVETNRLRGGACLVIAEGLCLKAPKILKHVSRLKIEGWEFLERFVGKDVDNEDDVDDSSARYLGEVIAGRPVLSHPSRKGGFRLRYGRCRSCGLASTAIHPAVMYLLDGFIAVGTQMKVERPGKGTIGNPCDEIDGPLVLLKNGDLVKVEDVDKAREIKDEVEEIVDLGEILIPYGEFVENNTNLLPSSYCYEWWVQELQRKLGIECDPRDYGSVVESDERTRDILKEKIGRDIDLKKPDEFTAFKISELFDVPLHPIYTLFWHDLSRDDVLYLVKFVRKNLEIERKDQRITLILPFDERLRDIFIDLGLEYRLSDNRLRISSFPYTLIRSCGLDVEDGKVVERVAFEKVEELYSSDIPVVDFVSKLSGVKVREKAPTRIGARMGRPEKASPRRMRPPPHVLFPVGNYGGNQRLINSAAEKGKIKVEVGLRRCPRCWKVTHRTFCECGEHTISLGKVVEREIDLKEELKRSAEKLGIGVLPDSIKGVIGTISKEKTPEPLEKGILRAMHGVFVFKDGTTRFDMTDAPLTHFRPCEIGVSVEKLRELGYERDFEGKELEREDQICELKVQDIIISEDCADYLIKVSKFVDDLLERFYGMERFYNIRKREDLIGHLVIGLAPHTSSGVVGRIIGFTPAQVCFAHPFYHAAKRRNCDGDEDSVMLLLDALLNFSLSYIPEKRGGRMDVPLILATKIDPREIDKEAHNIDALFRYPLDFYEATLKFSHPKEVEEIMDLVSHRLGTFLQYGHLGFTHDTKNISEGPRTSAYKTLDTMMEKIDAQLRLGKLIRAVDESDVARKVLEKHFLPDILGNLRAFSKQSIRCPSCNTIYRRIPLKGICPRCGGKLTLTVHKKSVEKYLDISKSLADKYNLPRYARQRLLLVEKSIRSLFGEEKRVRNLFDFE